MKLVGYVLLIFVAIAIGCTKTPSVTKYRPLLDSAKNMAGVHVWHGVHSENWPGIDTFYSVSDTFGIAVLNDSLIAALNDTLKLSRIDSVAGELVYMAARSNPWNDYTYIEYYSQKDSLHYVYQYGVGLAYRGTQIELHTP